MLGNYYFGFDTKSKGNQIKNKRVGLHQTETFCTAKYNYQQKKIYVMGENICIQMFDKQLMSKVCRVLIQLNDKRRSSILI